MKLNTKIIIIMLEISLIPLLLLGFMAYSTAEQRIIQNNNDKLNAIAQIQENRVQALLGDQQDLFALFSTKPQLRLELKAYNVKPTLLLQKSMSNNLVEAKANSTAVKQVFVTNPSGTVVASTDPALLGTNVSSENFFQQSLKQTNVSTLKKETNGNTVQYLTGPLSENDTALGILVMVADAHELIDLASDYAGLGNTGETILVAKDSSGDVLFLTSTRTDPGAGLVRVVPKDRTDVALVHAVSGEEQLFDNLVDYNHKPVFAATRYIKETGWGIVVKIEKSEVLASIYQLQLLFLVYIGLTGFFVTLIAIIMARTITKPIRKLTTQANKIAGGDLSQNIRISSQDEVGVLWRSFDTMRTKLQQSYDTLDEKVKSRTVDLDNANVATRNVLEDLLDEKQALALAKAQDDALLQSIGDGVMATDEKGIIIFANKTAQKLLGKTSKEMLGKSYFETIAIEDEKGTPIPLQQRPMSVALASGEAAITTMLKGPSYNYVRKDKTKFPAEIVATPVFINKQLTGTVEIFRDITQEKVMDRAKTEFVSLASHQLRTPTSAINWYAEMLAGKNAGPLNKNQKAYLEEISNSGQRMAELINTFLYISRLELGTLELKCQPTDIVGLVKLAQVELKDEIDSKHLTITGQFEENLPRPLADPKLIGIVVHNLLDNAVRYSANKGRITLSVKLQHKGDVAGGKKAVQQWVSIAIQDAGIGIPPSQKDKIFTRMFRADNARKFVPEGSGLGLYIIKLIVDLFKGEVRFTSTEGKGTTFYVLLPAGDSKSASPPK